nr:myomegalin-like isoform X3 [Gorilla gorilla gorilla]
MWICPGGGGGGGGGDREDARPAPRSAVGAAGALAVLRGSRAWLSRELQEKEKVIEVLQAKLDARSLTPSSSHALSDSHRSPSNTSLLSDELEACSDMDIASKYTHYEEKKASPGHSDSIHHSSHSAVLSSKPSSTSASQGVKAESNSNPISLPTPQNPHKEANQAHSGASTLPSASTATLPSNDLEADSSHYLNSAQPHSPPRDTIQLGRILEPGYLGSSGQWDMMRPQKGSVSGDLSSGSSVYQLNSKPTGADLLEEHLGEIPNLHQRLEESICINDRLWEQVEHWLTSTACGSGSTSKFYSQGLESIPQLCNENRVLREENRRLQAQLSHVSREHSQETESLREALLSSRSHLQELEKELEHQKVERQQLLEDLREKQQEVLRFREERLSLQENDSGLQHKLVLLQQQCEEKQQLFESLQSELQIYEALYGNSKKGLKDSAVSPPVWDVGMNSPALVFPNSASSTPGSETAIINRANGLGLDTSPVLKTPRKLEGDATDGYFANKHGRHVIGHIDDYSALRQQIAEGKLLVKKIVSLVRSACSFPGLEAQGTGVLGSKGIHELRSSTSALHHALEESASLLTMFWRVALPSTHIPVLPGKVGESTERELLELRTKVSKQERLLQSTAEHLKTASQQKESMEQFIVSQREIPKGSAVYSSLVTLAFQEPCKKRSHQKSLKQQERLACPPFVQLPIC